MSQNESQHIIDGLDKLSHDGVLQKLADLRDEHREYKLPRFNIFDVLHVTWRELPHSDFLQFLLDPKSNHNWGTAFLDLFLNQVCDVADGNDHAKMEVLREWQYIDILLKDESKHLIVVIENKITSGEGEGQLESYWCKIQEKYPDPDWTKKFIYLTPAGLSPSHSAYQAVGYDAIAQLIDKLMAEVFTLPSWELDPADKANVKSAVRQYVQMLRRHIMTDKEVRELSLEILREHLSSIQYLHSFYASWQKEMTNKIRDGLKLLISKEPEHIFADHHLPNYMRFGIKSLQDVQELQAPPDMKRTLWTPSGQLLLFVLNNQPGSLVVELFLYCDDEVIRDKMKPIREKTEKLAENTPPFHAGKLVSPWLRIYSRPLLTESDYQACDERKLLESLENSWRKFMEGDFEQIEQALTMVLLEQP